MAYQSVTLSEAEDLLAGMLGDLQGGVSKVRWPSLELQLNLLEALRMWGALTGIYEARTDPILVTTSSPWIDIPSVTSLRSYTLTVQNVIGQMQQQLWEPYDPIDGTGMSGMWTFARFVQAVQRRRNQFLFDTKCRLSRVALPALADTPSIIQPGEESYTLPESVIEVVRAAWSDPVTGLVSSMGEVSVFAAQNSRARILGESSTPRSYIASGAPIEIEFTPIPSNPGRLDLVIVESGEELDALANTLLGIPDDFVWAVKWGAMADLLAEDGSGRDYARALFCERRYRMGVAAALTNGPVIGARLNGRPIQFSELLQLDSARPNWQSKSGTPTVIAWAGMNLLALADPPSRSVNLELDIQRNTPVPASSGDYLQVGQEYLDLILGYAAHLSMFKVGGSEFAASTHLADNFFEAASEINLRLKASAAFQDLRMGKQEEEVGVRGLRRVTGNSVNEDQSGYK